MKTQSKIIKCLVPVDGTDAAYTLPTGSKVVHVAADTREPKLAVWMQVPTVDVPEGTDKIEAGIAAVQAFGGETWIFAFAKTGQELPAETEVLGTLVARGYASHVVRLAKAGTLVPKPSKRQAGGKGHLTLVG